MKIRTKNNRNSGLTMVETLAVVAIIVILMGVSAVAVIRHIDNLELTELDNAAREIYMAAQNRAVLLSANRELNNLVLNNESTVGGGISVALGSPHKNPEESFLIDADTSDDTLAENLYYVHADVVREALLENENIDRTLLDDGDFYIVYDLTSGSVTDVVYAKHQGSLSTGTLAGLLTDYDGTLFADYYENWWTLEHSGRREVKQKQNLPLVGWYYGEASQSLAQPVSPDGQPVIDLRIDNKEELTVTVTVYFGETNGVTDEKVRNAVKKALENNALSVKFGPENSDSDIGVELKTYNLDRLDAPFGSDGFSSTGDSYSRTWVLDSLTDTKRKFAAFNSTVTGVKPGENFEVTASIPKDDDNILNVRSITKKSNSLFAYVEGESGEDTAYIEYLRHLQNLDKEGGYISGVNGVTTAIQVRQDVWGDGNDDEGGTHKTFFTDGYSFIPIVNSELTLYNGLSAINSDGVETVYKIRNLKVRTSGNIPFGLFSKTPNQGMTFQNVRLVNTTVQAATTNTSTVGALVGQTSGNTIIDKCWVYWEPGNGIVLQDKDTLGLGENGDPADYNYQLAGNIVGGLVGTASGKVEITSSLAATTIKGGQFAGGLVGQIAGSGNEIKNSYADCYLTGDADAHVAGLIGDVQTDVELKKCYSAGFVLGVEHIGFKAAGLCMSDTGNITVNNAYSVMMYPNYEDGKSIGTWTDKIYGLTNRALDNDSKNNYYLGGANDGATSAIMTAEDFDVTMNTGGDVADGKFVWKTAAQSNPYNLRLDLRLEGIYSYPGLDGVDHYGDWGAEFKDPSLVYYEKYSTDAWGISGGNARNLLNVNNLQSRTVLSDGYAVAFLKQELDGEKTVNSVTIKFSYTNLDGSSPKIVNIGEPNEKTVFTLITDDFKNTHETTWKGDGDVTFEAYVIPLPDELVYSNFALDCFYRYVKFELYFEYTDGTSSLRNSGEYLFNPHFAEAIEIYSNDKDGDTTETPSRDWNNDGMKASADEKANVMGSVKIRTPRHLFNLSEFPEYYSNSKRYTFNQALGLDYSKYDWRGVHDNSKTIFEMTAKRENNNNNYSEVDVPLSNGKLTAPYRQSPIGRNENEPFTGAYEGEYNYIKNVLPNVTLLSAQNRYMGLFGYSTVRLRNIVYQMEPDENEKEKEDLYQMTTKPLSGITNNLYVGGLVGGNTGTVINCAVYGMDFKTDISAVKLYVGALVGLNNGSISNCSAESKKLAANAYYSSDLYIGGFVGENGNNRTISSSYAVGRINIEVDNTNIAQICGFAGKNSGTISDAYAAVDLQSSGLGVDPHGFSNEEDNGSQLKNEIGYLDQGSYTYRDINYAANYKPIGEEKVAKSYKYELLREVRFSGMGSPESAPQAGSYPFPAVVMDANNKYIHYGEVPTPLDLVDMGVLYWEVLNINGKETYHIDALAVKNTDGIQSITEVSNLSEAHDDGGVVTAYGYGYYYKDGDTKPTFVAENIGYFSYTLSEQNNRSSSVTELSDNRYRNGEDAVNGLNDQLEKVLSGYKVIAWNTYHEGGHGADWGHVNENGNNYGTQRQDKATNGLAPRSTWDPNAANGSKVGTFTLTTGNGNNQYKFEFAIDPHFAASMSVKSVKQGTNATDLKDSWVKGDAVTQAKLKNLPGTSLNPFQVRCGTQLQDINVSTRLYTDMCIGIGGMDASKNGELWNLPTAKYFPYLSSVYIFEETTTVNRETYNAGAIYPGDHTYYRYYYFKQTHDMDWIAEGNTYGDNQPGVFTPIAATAARVSNPSRDFIQLPGWFSGSYDGQNYTLKNFNIDINTSNYNTTCMGLFGAIYTNDSAQPTVLKNIVMYSETGTDTVIVRGRIAGASDDGEIPGGGGIRPEIRWYAGGVLVGVALGKSQITNCAVAGYKIIDQTRHAGGDTSTNGESSRYNYGPNATDISDNEKLGGAIGGLVGLTDGPLNGCVAVTTIVVEPNHKDLTGKDDPDYKGTSDKYSENMKYGGDDKPVRVGGLVGSTSANVTNCYTGGEIMVSSNAKDSNIYIGRVIGGVGAGVFGKGTSVSIENCYSYMSLPKAETKSTTVTSWWIQYNNTDYPIYEDEACTIRYKGEEKPTVGKTYYCSITYNRNNYTYFSVTANTNNNVTIRRTGSTNTITGRLISNESTSTVSTQTYNIGGKGEGTANLNNDMASKNYYLENSGIDVTGNGAEAYGTIVNYQRLSSDEMLTTLGASYDRISKDVKTSDGSKLDVPGRFSYVPQDRDDLRGLDFPFPTVLTQPVDPNNPTAGNYNVHYGGWTLYGIERYRLDRNEDGTVKKDDEGKELYVALGAQPVEVDIFSDQGQYEEQLRLSDGVAHSGTWKVKWVVEEGEEEEEKYITAAFKKEPGAPEIEEVKDSEGNVINRYYYYTETDNGTGVIPLFITALNPNETPSKVYVEYEVNNEKFALTRPIDVNVTANVKLKPGALTMYPGEIVQVKLTPIGIPTGTTYSLKITDHTSYYPKLLYGYYTVGEQEIRLATDFGEGDDGETVWMDVFYTYTMGTDEDAYFAEDTHGIFVDLKYLNREGTWEEDENGTWTWTIDLKDYVTNFAEGNVKVEVADINANNVTFEDNKITITLTNGQKLPEGGTTLTITTELKDEAEDPEDGIISRMLEIKVPAPIDLNPAVMWDEETPDQWTVDFSEYGLDELEVDLTEDSTFTIEQLNPDEDKYVIKTKAGVTIPSDGILRKVSLTRGSLRQTSYWTFTPPEYNKPEPVVKWNVTGEADDEQNSWIIDFSGYGVEGEDGAEEGVGFDKLEVTAPEGSGVEISYPDVDSKSVTLTLNDGSDVEQARDTAELKAALTKDNVTQFYKLEVLLPTATFKKDEEDTTSDKWTISFAEGFAATVHEVEVLTEGVNATQEVNSDGSVTLTLKKSGDIGTVVGDAIQVVLKATLSKGGLNQSCELTLYLSGLTGDGETVSGNDPMTTDSVTGTDGNNVNQDDGTVSGGNSADQNGGTNRANQSSRTVSGGDALAAEPAQNDLLSRKSADSDGDDADRKREQDDAIDQDSGSDDGDMTSGDSVKDTAQDSGVSGGDANND